jgi:hypothetical protein
MKLTTHLHLVPRTKNAWSYTSTPPIRLNGVVLSLKKHKDNFTCTSVFLIKFYELPFSEIKLQVYAVGSLQETNTYCIVGTDGQVVRSLTAFSTG